MMNASTWIELIATIATLAGGGSVGIARLTRIAVAVETLAGKIAELTATQAATDKQVQEHEVRLAKGGL